jgi:two-component system sensor histidine kinase BaeS
MATIWSNLRKVFSVRSLAFKLVLGFWLVSLVGIALIVLQARLVASREFGRFVNTQQQEPLVSKLESYYQTHGDWNGVEVVFQANTPTEMDSNQPLSLVLVDSQAVVIFSNNGDLPGSKFTGVQLSHGEPIWVNKEFVGMLIPTFQGGTRRPPPNDYLNRINQNLLLSSLGATAISLLLGLFLAWTLIRPLRELTAATRDVADGDLERQVPVRSKDELGELSQSFNQMNSKLKESRDLRRKMTADIAHELRTPLSLILGHTEALNEGKLPPTSETFYVIYDEAKRLSLLVEDLRTLSLSEAGELSLMQLAVQPSLLVKRGIKAYSQKARALNISLRAEIQRRLPSINVDPDRMAQVNGNLLDNSLHYTPSGGKVELAVLAVPEGVEFRVRDTGAGIPKADLPYIFNRFYRAEKSRNRRESGSGLGLAIAKSIVEAHGGRIWAESEPSQGTTIFFVIPITAK